MTRQARRRDRPTFLDMASQKQTSLYLLQATPVKKNLSIFFSTEKRAKYDSGEDPLDPEAQQGGGNPWQHGGFPFGEGFQFKFHFN